MESSETRVIFFQVADSSAKLKSIAETAKKHFIHRDSLIFFTEDEKAQSFVDELLWKFPPHSFLPHVAVDTITTERIAITKTKENVNHALFAFNLCSTPLFLSGFKLIYDFEDLSTPNKKSLAESRFSAYRKAHFLLESKQL